MEWCYREKFLFEELFSCHLDSATTEFYDEQCKEYQKWDYNSDSHIEEVEGCCDDSSKCKCSTVSHKDFGGIDIVKEES
jgi:hypothetical protein